MQAQIRGSKLERSLDDVVSIGISHELLKLVLIHKLFNHDSLRIHVSAADALLNDVGAEFLLREFGDFASEAEAERIGEARIIEIEDVLDNVIAKRVLNEMEAIGRDLADKLDLLEARGMVNTTLEDAAAVSVSADGDAVSANGIEDELGILRLEMVQALLDYVVAV